MGWKKAQPQQGYIKALFYGPQGTGKTVSALLCAEGLVGGTGKRIAMIDTERGSDFYAIKNDHRMFHPAPFDFDAEYTKSLTVATKRIRELKWDECGCLIIDSLTHLWESAQAAFAHKQNGDGKIPFHVWGAIKRPFRDLITYLIDAPVHVILCAREGTTYSTDADTKQTKQTGAKADSEKNTAYEPHIVCRFALETVAGATLPVNCCHVEKDRTSVIHGKVIDWPGFDSLFADVLPLLGATQAIVDKEEDAAFTDRLNLEKDQSEKVAASTIKRDQLVTRFSAAKTLEELMTIGKEITDAVKRTLLPEHLEALTGAFKRNRDRLVPKGAPAKSEGPKPAAKPAPQLATAAPAGDAFEPAGESRT